MAVAASPGKRWRVARLLVLAVGAVMVFIGFFGWGLSELAFSSLGPISAPAVDSILAQRGIFLILTGIGFLVSFVGLGLQART